MASPPKRARHAAAPSRQRAPIRRISVAVLPAVAIVLAGCLAYASALPGPFLLDDRTSIVENPQIRTLWPLTVPLSPPRETPVAGRPVVNLSFALNYAAGGLDVTGYRAVNLAVHVLVALVLFGIVRRTLTLPAFAERFGRPATGLALVVSLVWALHPLQTETVNYVTQRTESLMGLFYLLTLYCGIRSASARASSTRTTATERRWAVAAIVSCALGMMSKESMVTAPLMLALYDRVFLYGSFRQAVRERAPLYMGVCATWLLLGALMWGTPRSSVGFSTATSPWVYLLNQVSLIVDYLRLTVWPRALVLDYGLPQAVDLGDVLGPALIVTGLALTTVMALVYRPSLGFLGAWFFVTLAPTTSVVPIATEVGAERRMYLPLIACVVLAVVGWHVAVRRLGAAGDDSLGTRERLVARLGMVVAAAVCLLLAWGTTLRNREYESALTMARTVVERRPHGRAYLNLGAELLAEGRKDEAMTALWRSADVYHYAGARFALGTELIGGGSINEGIEQLQAFISQIGEHPTVGPARALLAQALFAEGRLAEAADELTRLVEAQPTQGGAHALLGEIRLRQGRPEEAIRHYEAALVNLEATAPLLGNLGIALGSAGRIPEAIGYFERAVAVDPAYVAGYRNLARAYLEGRDPERAAIYARRALDVNPSDGVARELLNAALARRAE